MTDMLFCEAHEMHPPTGYVRATGYMPNSECPVCLRERVTEMETQIGHFAPWINSTVPTLRTLECLAYITECFADDLLGEAKEEIRRLIKCLERDRRFTFDDANQIAAELRIVEEIMTRNSGDQIRDGKRRIFKASQFLWKRILGQLG